MARYKPVDLSPRFLAVDLEKQLLPGSFAHAVERQVRTHFYCAPRRNRAAVNTFSTNQPMTLSNNTKSGFS